MGTQTTIGGFGEYDPDEIPEFVRVRMTQLMEEYYGKIDVEIAKATLADHYDVYLKKENNPCSRTVSSSEDYH